VQRSVPVRKTYSLLRDFPLAYGQLKKTGRCTFGTTEQDVRLAYPGTRAYRIRAASVIASVLDPSAPIRGILVNQGVSIVDPDAEVPRVAIRPAEGLPISEFQLLEHLDVYGLPDETLLTFEGSHLETFWEVSVPAIANPGGLEALGDVLVTLDMLARFDPDAYTADMASVPGRVRRWVVLSADHLAPSSLDKVQSGAPSATIALDMRVVPNSAAETKRKVRNLAIFTISKSPVDLKVKVTSGSPATSATVTLKSGVAMTTAQPNSSLPALPATPLDPFLGKRADLPFSITVTKADNPTVDAAAIKDLVLAIEYEADLTP
jgi:hypothetical protein